MLIKTTHTPPVAERNPHQCNAHGQQWIDDYAWLRADNWQEAMRTPEALPDPIKNYLLQENTYYEEAMADTQVLQKQLIAEMRGRILEREDSLPDKDGPWDYAYRYIENGEHPVYLRRLRETGEEQVTIDINTEAEPYEYFDYDLVDHSPDHKTLAWSRDTSGAEYYQLSFRDLATGTDSSYTIDDVDTVAWANNNTVFYTRVDENHRPNKVFRHQVGSDPKNDSLVFEEQDPRFSCAVETSASESYVFISTGMNDQDEVWFIPTDNLHAEPTLIEPRTDNLEYSVEHQNDRFLILTNADNAIDFKIIETKVNQPGREHWTDLVPHKAGNMVRSVEAYQDWFIWLVVENALPKICYARNNDDFHSIDFKEEAYSLSLDTHYEFNSHSIRVGYSSPTTPTRIYEFDLASGNRTLLKEQTIPSGHNSDDYITRRITAVSHDGAEVPVTLLHHKNTELNGTAPCLLYGYGSYGASIPASFSANRLCLVNRGFVFAIAHVRGGQEKGRAWYEQAKFAHKVNSFHDLIAAAETLIEQQYTAQRNITIQGGSAGGLLVGAVANMRPDLLGGIIADVPFVDVLNTILDETLPLTPGEWSQWGNPVESEQAFKDISAYSPYDNVTAQDYPPMLVTAGVSDPRVTYWEPAKWVAKLRATKTDDNCLLLKTNMSSGHYGKTGRYAALEDAALSYAFAIAMAGDSVCSLEG